MTPRLAWYGDDFTGSTAVMDILAMAGLRTVLFLERPGETLRARFFDMEAVGLAGTARAQDPAWMDRQLPAIFDWLDATGAALVHYKICSTLDSGPDIGSIGRAAEVALARFGGTAPCLVAAPTMGRYQCYGQLFATGPDGRVHRLDRHPVMARHPVTPMDEADVVRHLARQTDLPIALIDLDALYGGRVAPTRSAPGIVFLDAQREADLAACGALIEGAKGRFVLGSQGVEMALVAHWQETGALSKLAPPRAPAGTARMAVISGSASATTGQQIDAAEEAGFACLPVDAALLAQGGEAAVHEVARAADAAIAAHDAGADPLVATCRGPDDPAFRAARAEIAAQGTAPGLAAERIGTGLGDVLGRIASQTGVRRVAIAGGDTSGSAAPRLGVQALTPLVPSRLGASLSLGHGTGLGEGLQVALKGGQMGAPDVFARLRAGLPD